MRDEYLSYSDRVEKASSGPGLAMQGTDSFRSSDRDKIFRGDNIIGIFDGERRIFTNEDNVTTDTLWDLVRESPEFQSIVRARIADILADGWEFKGSKSAINKAKKFEIDSQFHCKLADALFDMHVVGDGFLLKLFQEQNELNDFVQSELDRYALTDVRKDSIAKRIMRTHINAAPKDLQVIGAVGMQVDADQFGNIKGWVQRGSTLGQDIRFDAKDIVQINEHTLSGNVHGFSPAHTLIKDITTLVLAKDSAHRLFSNDGVPLGMFNLPNANPNNERDLDLLRDQLRKLSRKQNRLRTIVTTGEVNFQNMKSMSQDLEFKELIEHFTMIILLAWGMPAHRVPLLIKNTKMTPKEANDGYFKTIAYLQRRLESQLNKYLWSEFKVTIHFNRTYRIDQFTQAQIATMIADRNLATIEELREKHLGLPRKMPAGMLPINMKGGVGTFSTEERLDTQLDDDGSEKDETDNQMKMVAYLGGEPQ
jgi:hypothetical protein